MSKARDLSKLDITDAVSVTVNNTATVAQMSTDTNNALLVENTNAAGVSGLRMRGGSGKATIVYGENNSTDEFSIIPRNDTSKAFTIDSVGNVVVAGNLQIEGSQTVLNTATLSVEDLNITLASGATTDSEADGAGLTVAGAAAQLKYDATQDRWQMNKGLELLSGAALVVGTGTTDVGRVESSSGVLSVTAYTGRQIAFGNDTNGEHVRIDADGLVGIGTNDPGDPLHVEFSNNTGSDTGIIVKNTSTGTTSNFAGLSTQAVNGSVTGIFSSADYDAWGVGTFVGSQSNHPTYLIANNAVKMTLETSGNATFSGNVTTGASLISTNAIVDNLLVKTTSGSMLVKSNSGANIARFNNILTTDLFGSLDVTGNIAVSGTVDGVDIAARDAVLTSTTTTAGAALPKTGGTMTGNLNMGSQDITNLDTLASTHFSTSANVNSSGDGGLSIPSGQRLGFDQSGTRSWTQYAAGGNLLFASGDGNGAIQANNFTGVTYTASGLIKTTGDVEIASSQPRLHLDRGDGSYSWSIYNGNGSGSFPLSTFNIANNAGTAVITALDDGKVGIGTTVPAGNLHIVGEDGVIGASTLGGSSNEFIIENNSDAGMTIRSGADGYGVISFADPDDHNTGQVYYNHSNDKMSIITNDAVQMTVDSVGTVDVSNDLLTNNAKLKAIAKERAGTTAVDIFVYDTRKDSDGGAWRKRTKNTSWYNETLNTSTRGVRKEFPVTAVIVCELARVLILDGDDPDLPTWMIFNGLEGGSSYTWHGSGYSGESNRCVAMLNGTLAIGVRGSISSVSGLSTVNFIEEMFHKYGGAAGSIRRDISQRNNAFSVRNDTTGNHGAASKNIYDVAMTVEKGADIDPGTGLPKVTIAIATSGGLSIVKKSGANNTEIIHITAGSGGAYNGVGHVDITDENWLMFEQDNSAAPRSEFFIPIPDGNRTTQTNDGIITDKVVMKFYSNATHNYPYFKGQGIVNAKPMKGQAHALKGSGGELTLVDPNPYDQEHSSVCYIGADHNTGWLTGGTKLAALNSTTSGTVVGTDVLGGIGNFTDAGAWTVPTGWSLSSNIATGTAVTAYLLPATNGLLVPGEQYRITISQPAYTSGTLYLYMGTGAPGTGNHYINLPSTGGTFTYTLVAYNSNFGLYGAGYTGQIDNVTIVKCDPDRSAWTAGVEAIGTVNKTAVATGAELMAYGPFTSSNYLQQPYNSQLQVGTGAVTYSAWCYKSGGVVGYLFDRANANGTNRFGVYFAGSTSIDTYTPGGALNGIIIPDNEWFNYTAVKANGKIIVYINGERKGSIVTAENLSVNTNDNIPLKIGVRYTVSNPATDLKISLFKVTATAVSHSQVRKNYEDEKRLFSENAKATIGGSSDLITGFGYDSDTELLHVGSSWGRSSFDGLTRAEYSTDVVTTAIDASNGLVAEE